MQQVRGLSGPVQEGSAGREVEFRAERGSRVSRPHTDRAVCPSAADGVVQLGLGQQAQKASTKGPNRA
eukprot:CAMPEP_0174374196 /NCGR_PEP_ID=MMETSP0811_2-20130205/110011_1 /TAXON_ID=73025 ORGANISM="Eutreptiella gymnastica-like, Strain CCMP1594" /NCGR_SAMPLE_ID=MMETSP0811_2 /ASSEMBLY_ACC=CAM_ASM_000667 /LENGTH=67 /DNA_ID=CAMNT_0015523303 /DNA_START=200 /DNA_END=400 /DNA_ORIENTATION=-